MRIAFLPSGRPSVRAVNPLSSSGHGLVLGMALRHHALMDYEYVPLRLPQHVDRATATAQLTIAAEYSGWELARVRLFSNGTRQVLLRRRRTEPAQPALSY
jgi:Family of unknown function (DUF5703)